MLCNKHEYVQPDVIQAGSCGHSNGNSGSKWHGIYYNSEPIKSIGKALLRGDSFDVFTTTIILSTPPVI